MNLRSTISRLTLKEKIGQMLVVGFGSGTQGQETLRRVVEETAAGNIILFARNGASAPAAAASTAFARSVVRTRSGIEPLVAIDQEGGIVARIDSGITPLPGAMALAAGAAGYRPGEGSSGWLPDSAHGDFYHPEALQRIKELCRIVARDLRNLGIDWNLGPVADVNVNPANPVIGSRSFGEDQRRVAVLARTWFEGMRDGGILTCAKHFPGHGDTEIDSHLDLPLVAHEQERLDAVELYPFRELIAAGIPAILTAHVRFPAIEPEALPATLSRRVLTGLLRERLGFQGLIVTDCMEMQAIAAHYRDTAVKAILAGADLILLSHTEAVQCAAALDIARAVERGRIPESRIDESVERILAAKASLRSVDEAETARSPVLLLPGMGQTPRLGDRSRTSLSPDQRLHASPQDSRRSGEPTLSSEPDRRESSQEKPQDTAGEGKALAALLAQQSLALADDLPFPHTAEGGYYIEIAPASSLPVGENPLNSEARSAPPSVLTLLDPQRWAGATLPLRASPGDVAACLRRLDVWFSTHPGLPVLVGLYNASTDGSQISLLATLEQCCRTYASPLGCVAMRTPFDALLLPHVPVLCAYEYTRLSVQAVAGFLHEDRRQPQGSSPVDLARQRAIARSLARST